MKKTCTLAALLYMLVALVPSISEATQTKVYGHIPDKIIAISDRIGPVPDDADMAMAISLPLRNLDNLNALLKGLYDPKDPLYGHYLTTEEFITRFAPTQEDYDAVAAYVENQGFKIRWKHKNRTLLQISGSALTAKKTFNIALTNYKKPNGSVFHAPDSEPELPAEIASKIAGVVGLSNAAEWRSAAIYYSGIGGLAPADIITAYNMNAVGATGIGQNLAVLEYGSFLPTDIYAYEQYNHINNVQLIPISVGGASLVPVNDWRSSETTLDIEIALALAPGLNSIAIYVMPDSYDGFLSGVNQVANDNNAKQVSISLNADESELDFSYLNSEYYAFAQMATQGQSVYACSGDWGALGTWGENFTVNDPAGQPFVTSVGGTTLNTSINGGYVSENAWDFGIQPYGGGATGGGVSNVWPIPSWQQNLASAASHIMRNVPDVALNADGKQSGYSIYYWGSWWSAGGTSASTPLWAAFNALVNEKRVNNGSPVLGLAAPFLYQIAAGPDYLLNFHDITQGNNAIPGSNAYYFAQPGYDNVTGLGSFNGYTLWSTLTTPPPVPSGLTAAVLAGSGSQRPIALSWNSVTGPVTYSIFRGTTPGGEGGVPIASGITGTSFTDTESYNGTYYYKVSAQNIGGTSALSSSEASASLMDTVPPTGSVNINGGASASYYTTVAIYPSAIDNVGGSGVNSLQFSSDNVHWSTWYPFMTSFMYTYPGKGWRYIFIRYGDFAGNISQTYGAAIYIL